MEHQAFVKDLATAIRAHAPMPAFPEGLTLEAAYSLLPDVARTVVDNRICGIKAGLTNPDLVRLFGLEESLLGLLYDWGECQPGARLPYRDNSQIECELGIRLDAQGRPISIGPAIEIVHLDFSQPQDFNAPNLVVCALGADRFICGEQTPWEDVNFDALRDTTIRLSHDGELVLKTAPYDSLGGPERALEWCLGEAKKRDIEIADNAILLTGTCGSALPLAPGSYIADYGSMGRIAFEID